MLRKPGIASDGPGNCGFDLTSGLGDRLTGVAAQPTVQLAGAWNGARPIATVDDANIEIDWVLKIGKCGVGLLVETSVQFLKGLHDRYGFSDGIHALPGLHRMPRFANNADAKPEDSDMCVSEAAAGRFGDDRGVR